MKTSQASKSDDRPLADLVIGISVSNSDDLDAHGYTPSDVNRISVRLSEMLLAAGARLLFGHDWRPDGVMTAICAAAARHQSREFQSDFMIRNIVAWPDQPQLDEDLRRELASWRLVDIEALSLRDIGNSAMDSTIKRAAALSQLRRHLADQCDARVCIGGQSGRNDKKVSGFFPGVVEEAYWTIAANKPLLLGGFLGGVSAQMIRYLERRESHPANIFSLLPDKIETHSQVAQQFPSEPRDWLPPQSLADKFSRDQVLGNLDRPKAWDAAARTGDVESFGVLVVNTLARHRDGRS